MSLSLLFLSASLLLLGGLLILVAMMKRPQSPFLLTLKAAGVRPGEAVRLMANGACWTRQDTLMTDREIQFLQGLLRTVDLTRWYLCPQVRVADIVQVSARVPPRSKDWWALFRMTSQWHCDVVIVERQSFRMVAVVELDDATHQKAQRQRRDIVFGEVMRQADIPLLRSRDSRELQNRVREFLAQLSDEHDAAGRQSSN